MAEPTGGEVVAVALTLGILTGSVIAIFLVTLDLKRRRRERP